MPQAILLASHENLGGQGHGRRRLQGLPPQLPDPPQARRAGDARRDHTPRPSAVRWPPSAPSPTRPRKAEESAALLNKTVLTIAHQAGDDGRLFGFVTSQDIVDAIKEARGITLDKRDVHLEEPIKTVGTRMVVVEDEERRDRDRQDHGGRAEVAAHRSARKTVPSGGHRGGRSRSGERARQLPARCGMIAGGNVRSMR